MLNQPSKPIILKAKGISKAFYLPSQVSILRELDLTVHQGESVAIMGRSGEGKSTLLHILGTLENPCEGRLEIANQEISTFNKSQIRSRHLAFIFQSFHLLEDYTAIENVLMPARIARHSVKKGSPFYVKGMELLEYVGLKERAHFHTKLLSGGEKQRVAIARALCNDPDLILADEPSGNLDHQTARHIHDLLLGFTRERQKSLIVVTHDRELAALCDHTYQLSEGALNRLN
jgi:lipoprotein-releasing system ATP-binding protein